MLPFLGFLISAAASDPDQVFDLTILDDDSEAETIDSRHGVPQQPDVAMFDEMKLDEFSADMLDSFVENAQHPAVIPIVDVPAGMYFETQQSLKCGIHAVNNLLQRSAVDVEFLDRVIENIRANQNIALLPNDEDGVMAQYDFKNELGDYEIDVLQIALQDLGTFRLNQSLMACRL